MTTEVILVKVVETCCACPSQWDAWDLDGHYWYLRYRHGRGTADRQPGPDWRTWSDKSGDLHFTNDGTDLADGVISLRDFCQMSGLNLAPNVDLTECTWCAEIGADNNYSVKLDRDSE